MSYPLLKSQAYGSHVQRLIPGGSPVNGPCSSGDHGSGNTMSPIMLNYWLVVSTPLKDISQLG